MNLYLLKIKNRPRHNVNGRLKKTTTLLYQKRSKLSMKFKLSETYKHLIYKIAGIKNDMEFQSLLLLFDEYEGAKEDEEIEENYNDR